MNYLFYDLEFASCKDGHKICEFGYVVTDENLLILDENNFVINPNIKGDQWDYYALKHVMKKKKDYYEKNPTFPSFYGKIVELFKNADYVFGHTNDCDAEGLNDECIRYGLEPINHVFYDVKEMYKVYTGNKKSTGLDKMIDELGQTGDLEFHNASNDAYNTMVALRTMLENKEMTLAEFLELCPNSRNESKDLKVESIERNKEIREQKKEEILANPSNKMVKGTPCDILFKRFLEAVRPQGEVSDKLKGKTICFSSNYTYLHYSEMLKLVQLIVNNGGTYTNKASDSDIFVKFDEFLEDGSVKECMKLKFVSIHNETEDKPIEIITLDQFYQLLGVTDLEVLKMPIPDLSTLWTNDILRRRRSKNSKRNKAKEEKKESVAPIQHLTSSLENIIKEYMNR